MDVEALEDFWVRKLKRGQEEAVAESASLGFMAWNVHEAGLENETETRD